MGPDVASSDDCHAQVGGSSEDCRFPLQGTNVTRYVIRVSEPKRVRLKYAGVKTSNILG